jgi:hypothetical protein
MPFLESQRVRPRMVEKGFANANGFADAKALAEAVPSVPYGSLRNAVAGLDPINLGRAYDIAEPLKRDDESLDDTVADILTKESLAQLGGRPRDPRKSAA